VASRQANAICRWAEVRGDHAGDEVVEHVTPTRITPI
jgi:hypothetical protein